MKKIKKPLSVLLALMMVVSLFAIVPITASADVGDYVPESDYLTFTAVEAGSSVTLNVSSGSNLQYNKNNSGWQSYTAGTPIGLENEGDYVRFRGKGTTFDGSNHVSIDGKVACSGNVMSPEARELWSGSYSRKTYCCSTQAPAMSPEARELRLGSYSQ